MHRATVGPTVSRTKVIVNNYGIFVPYRPQAIAGSAVKRQLFEANVQAYAKIIDVSQGRSDLMREQIQKVADIMHGPADGTARGPVAFVIDPPRIGFPNMFADLTKGERPIQLFPARGAGVARAHQANAETPGRLIPKRCWFGRAEPCERCRRPTES